MQNTILQSTESINYTGRGILNGAAYDTAWAARITDQHGNSVFPECVRWLLENQSPDGSWGSQVLNYHDRVISTLSAIMALKEIDGKRYAMHIQRGESYIWENMKNLNLDDYRLIGSELLFPSLMQQAETMGLDLPYHMKVYQKEYLAKLSKIDESMWYSPLITLSHSLESLGDEVDVERLPCVLLPNGSVTNSPAATAFYLKHKKDARALMYLKEILSLTGDGSLTTIYPTEVFEYGWSTYNLMLAGLYFERYSEICNFLLNHLSPSGVGWSTKSPVTDADDTAVVCKILNDMGFSVDFRVFDPYKMNDYYMTFEFELDPSISTNIHVLDFVRSCPEFPDREAVIERLIRFLKGEMHSKRFWIDKWHVSPYYPTAHAIFALCDVDPSLAEKAISWILESQHENGMWGRNGGTVEETAYAVQALMYYHQKLDHIDISGIQKALPHLYNISDSHVTAELWIGKVLYPSAGVTYSTVVSAQFMSQCAKRQAAWCSP
jgi:halimadienyl-diphosphate synthase